MAAQPRPWLASSLSNFGQSCCLWFSPFDVNSNTCCKNLSFLPFCDDSDETTQQHNSTWRHFYSLSQRQESHKSREFIVHKWLWHFIIWGNIITHICQQVYSWISFDTLKWWPESMESKPGHTARIAAAIRFLLFFRTGRSTVLGVAFPSDFSSASQSRHHIADANVLGVAPAFMDLNLTLKESQNTLLLLHPPLKLVWVCRQGSLKWPWKSDPDSNFSRK